MWLIELLKWIASGFGIANSERRSSFESVTNGYEKLLVIMNAQFERQTIRLNALEHKLELCESHQVEKDNIISELRLRIAENERKINVLMSKP